MLLVFQDLPTGYVLCEEVAAQRTLSTWKRFVEERLKALGTTVWYLVSDRAIALVQLAEQELGCPSMPDLFHVLHDLSKGYGLALGQRLRQAHQALQQGQEKLAKLQERLHSEAEALAAEALVEGQHTEVQRWEDVRHTYRRHLETLSLTLHPFCLTDSTPQSSAQVAQQLHGTLEGIETLARQQHLPSRQETMNKVRKQVPGLAALVDCWWQHVRREIEVLALTPLWQQWVLEGLLPWVYWRHQAEHTRCGRRKAQLRQAVEGVATVFWAHPLTQQMEPQVLEEWQVWAGQRTRAFQRTSSAVEGRNGVLSQLHHNQRGLPKSRYRVWTILHNFDCRARDGTTPAARFFQRTFPDLFKTLLSHLEALPAPRKRKHLRTFNVSNDASVPL